MSLKLFYSQLNLHSSALHECLKRCSPAMQACLKTYDDTLYCTIPGAGLQWVWRKISFSGAWAERQRKWGKALKFVAFSPRSRAKGNAKRETRRNPLPLKPARSLKGNVNVGKRQNPLPPRRLLRRQPPHFPMSP